jgi:hypothetical protein
MRGATNEDDRRFVVADQRDDNGGLQHEVLRSLTRVQRGPRRRPLKLAGRVPVVLRLRRDAQRRAFAQDDKSLKRADRSSKGVPIFDLVAIGAALAVKFLAPSPAWIEAHYSNGLYPPIDRVVRAITGPLPFTLGDVLFVLLLVALVTWWVRRLRAAPRGNKLAIAGRLMLRTVAVAGLVFVWFAVSWAFNYDRIPLADKIPVHNERTNEDSVTTYAEHVVDELSRTVTAAHREIDERHPSDADNAAVILPRFTMVIARLGDRAAFAPPRIKPTMFQPLFEASATSGFTDPWTHEVNLDASAFAFERPALYAHEWAHISGFADESEANLISVLACTTSRDPLLEYSGWLLTFFNLPPSIHVKHHLKRQAYLDIKAIIARYRRQVKPAVEKASRNAYDQYLKANHVKAGFDSYHLFVRWLTGADFDRDGLPLTKPEVQ